MARTAKYVWLVALLAAACGCQNNPFFSGPRFLEPAGSDAYQQARAQRFDPYPETNVGPKVDGGRPEGYDAPPPEAARARPESVQRYMRQQ